MTGWLQRFGLPGILALSLFATSVRSAEISTVEDLRRATEESEPGDAIVLAAGVYELSASLELKEGVKLQGAGMVYLLLVLLLSVIVTIVGWNGAAMTFPVEHE